MALLNITTRETAITATDTNETTEESTNAGAALTNAQLDQNFINIKNLVDANAARMNTALNADGSIKDLVITVDDLAANSLDYSKLKSIHYVPVASESSINDTVANKILVKVNTLTSLDAGMLFFVKATIANTGGVVLTLSNSTTALATEIEVVKRGSLALVSGDIKVGQVILVLYDGAKFQLLNDTAALNIELADLANRTAGQLISFAASTHEPVAVAAGTVGQVLTANTAAPPSFQDAVQAGTIEYIASDETSAVQTSTTAALVMATVDLTAAQISKYSKLLITAEILGSSETAPGTTARNYSLFQGSTALATRNYKRNSGSNTGVADSCDLASFSFIETSPGTSASTFQIRDNASQTAGFAIRCFNLRIYGIG